MHGTSLLSTPGQFGPVLLPWVSGSDDEEHCFLNKFGFRSLLSLSDQDLFVFSDSI